MNTQDRIVKTNLLIVLLAMLVYALPSLVAQDNSGTDIVLEGLKDPATGNNESVNDVFDDLTEEQLGKLVAEASVHSLKVERQTFIDEIKHEALFEAEDIERAIKLVEKDVLNSRVDNIKRMCQATAIVDELFREGYELYKSGKYEEAAESLGKKINVEDTSCISAVMQYMHAQALLKAKKPYDAIDSWTNILVNLPDRLSFAAESAINAAREYDKLGRGAYAMQMYTYYLKNYSLVTPREEMEKAIARMRELQVIYQDPMAALAKMMTQVSKKLEKKDSGKETQQKEQEVLALLEDLIKTQEEEQEQQQQQGQQQGQQPGQKPGQQPGQKPGQQPGQQPGPASGNDTPQVGASDSNLVPGEMARPSRKSTEFDMVDSDKWVKLPPRDRERVRAILKKQLTGRWGGLIRDYHTKRSEGN